MRARWKLGQLLAKMERGHGPGRGKKTSTTVTSFRDYLDQINLDRQTAVSVQRLGTLPASELATAFRQARDQDVLCTFTGLVKLARPYWYKASRENKHRAIKASAKSAGAVIGPFPLIYADPPWKFEIYSPKG